MHLPHAALLAALLLPAAARAELATLRTQAVVEEATIRVGDIFADSGEAASRAVGPAPAPGRRIVVETAQLLNIARAHGVSWRPFTANDRAVIERPGRPMANEEWLEPLRAALVRAGMEPDAELELPGFTAPMVPPGAFADVTVEQVSLASDRFGATLSIVAEGMPAQRLRVSGRALPTVEVAVATRRLAIGEVARPGDVVVRRIRADRARHGLATDAAQVVGQQLRRPLTEGMPFVVGDLGAPTAVEKNTTVTMVLDAGPLSLTTQGRALATGSRGATVEVMNLASRQVVEALVIGPGRVRVGPVAR